jgi:hypothetical protein
MYGALVVKDSRVTETDNEKFLDLLEGTRILTLVRVS